MKSKWALKALGIFFAAMIALTLIARVGDSLMIANVKVDFVMSSTLNHEARVDAAVEGRDVHVIWAQPGLRVARVSISAGAKVAARDVLMAFDPRSITEKVDAAQFILNNSSMSAPNWRWKPPTAICISYSSKPWT